MTNVNTDNKRKVRLILVALLVTIAIVTGSIFAFFSDVVDHNTTITAGTLDLVPDATVIKQNGTTVASVTNFNPGDVVTFTVPVTNAGNKSAWLRGALTLTGTAVTTATDKADFIADFSIYEGALTQVQAEAQKGSGTDLASAITFTTGTNAVWVDPTPAVINGVGTGAETETTSTVPVGTDIYAGNTGTILTYTLYFKTSALNKWQDKTVAINYKAEAMQYRNNDTPSWTGLETK